MKDIFTYRDNVEGKVGIGKLPNELQSILNDISKEYYNIIPDKNVSTHHLWYNDMPPNIKLNIENIQKHKFWNKLCDSSPNCIKINVNEMDELYYSNFKKTANNTLTENLYGTTGNIVVHKDCHSICSFNNAVLYRIIIGLTDDNDNIITQFSNLDIGHKINSGDYILFDFSRTTHQVIKENQSIQTPRILLKLHFLVCEDCKYSNTYINFLKKYFINYDIITRYLLKNGTDPKTFYQFFIGLLCQYFYTPNIEYIILFLTILIIIILNKILKIKLIYKNLLKIIKYIFLSLFILYFVIVFFYWARYQLFGIR